MAHLLGSKYCIESLSKDVGDLQTAVVDILSRSGPVRCPSWKYPDRQSMDVDVNDLLELYTYSDDAEESQITHIVLLEMVIDRMVLLLQAVAQFLDGMLNFGRGLSAKNTGSFNSVGLVVKKYWNKMVHLNTVIQQLHSEVKTKSRKIADMENTIIKLQSQVQHLENSPPSNNTVNDNDIFDKIPPPNFHMQKSIQISRDEYTKSTQTVETAFIPCESCHGVQNSLRDVGKLVSSVCESQGLPSTLAKHMEQIESIKWLSGNDVTRWTTAQNKDLTKIDQHLTQLMANIEPLQNELQVERKQHKIALERMNEAEKKAKLERETQRVQQRQYENRLKDMERSKQTEVEEQKMEYSRLMEVRDKMEGQIEQMQAEQEKQQGLLKQLEEAKLQLISDYENDSAHKTQVELLSVDITKLQTEVKNVNLLLNKEKAKNRSVNKHSEMLQMKQSSLVGRIDVIDRENDELREQMNEMEESRDKLSEQLEETEMEKKQLNETLASEKRVIISLEKNKARLETSIRELENNIEDSERQLKVAQDRERLMIEYPDLNGPVNRDITGTGDLVIDMENQVSANMLRIQVLETQNSKLRNSVMKLLETQGQKRDKVQYESSKPVTLWRPDDATEYQEQLASNRTQTNQYTDDSESDRFSLGYESSPTVRSPSPEKVQATSATNIGKKQPSNIRVAWSEHMTSRKTPTKRMTDVKSLISGRSAAGKESSGKHTVLGGGFVVGKAPSRPSSGTKSTKSRPTSAKPSLQAVPSSSSIAAYKKLKDAGMIKTDANTKDTARLQSGRPAPASGRNTNQSSPMISCVKCDKMFTCKSDLEIHKSYCFGGI